MSVKIEKKFFYNDNPNFTIIMPVGCNASCDFCFNSESEIDPVNFYINLKENLKIANNLGIKQVSISGGEPTIYLDVLMKVLKQVNEHAPSIIKNVLTTNGYQLRELLMEPKIGTYINHINLSIHSSDLDEHIKTLNLKKDSEKSIYTKENLMNLISLAESKNIDVTINYVYTDIKRSELYKMVEFCKEIGVVRLCLRRDISLGIKESGLINEFIEERNLMKSPSSCPVCNVYDLFLRGFPVSFKFGVKDTYDYIELLNYKAFELIMHKNGKLTIDWAGNHVIDTEKGTIGLIKPKEKAFNPTREKSHGSGCGSSCTSRYFSSSCGGGC